MQSGVVDNSGLRLYYTKEARKYDAAVLTTGHNVDPLHIIAPGQSDWVSVGHCSTDCTSKVHCEQYDCLLNCKK